jgi:uncharacterized phage protein gp47/JayE
MADDVQFLTWREIYDQIVSFFPPSWRVNLPGKVLARLLVAYSLALEGLYGLLAKVRRLAIISTSEGTWLRGLVAGFGMTTFAGIKSSAVVQLSRFTPADAPISIPMGTRFRTQSGQQFTSKLDATFPVGATQIDIEVQCVEPGAIGNVGAGQIIGLVDAILGIDVVTNLQPAINGTEAESDTRIKARVPIYIEMLHRATIPAVEGKIFVDNPAFPNVRQFKTERLISVPGYFRGVLDEVSGGDLYRPAPWIPTSYPGTYYTIYPTQVYGLTETAWPCKRFGVWQRAANGEEQWLTSSSSASVTQGDYRWFYDTTNQRLYARADGANLNDLDLTVQAGILWDAYQELKTNWVAAGISFDIIAPTPIRINVALSYSLEPSYTASAVEAQLSASVGAYFGSLRLGQDVELENLYAWLSGVAGAANVLVQYPAGNVVVEINAIARLASAPTINQAGY